MGSLTTIIVVAAVAALFASTLSAVKSCGANFCVATFSKTCFFCGTAAYFVFLVLATLAGNPAVSSLISAWFPTPSQIDIVRTAFMCLGDGTIVQVFIQPLFGELLSLIIVVVVSLATLQTVNTQLRLTTTKCRTATGGDAVKHTTYNSIPNATDFSSRINLVFCRSNC